MHIFKALVECRRKTTLSKIYRLYSVTDNFKYVSLLFEKHKIKMFKKKKKNTRF